MKNYFFLLIIAVLSSSCEKNHGGGSQGYLYRFFPRKVNYMRTSVGKQVTKYTYNGQPYADYEALTGDVVGKNEWFLSIGALNFNPDTLQDIKSHLTLIDSSIPEVQKLLIQDYEKNYDSQASNSSDPTTVMVEIEYRTSPILNLTIRSLNTPLFGKPAGESLNDFFKIIGYNPAIISTPNYRLIYGFADQKSVSIPIDEWLSMRPLAQVSMWIAPNKPLTGLPLDVQFVVEMETDEGLVLRDTTRMFTITE